MCQNLLPICPYQPIFFLAQIATSKLIEWENVPWTLYESDILSRFGEINDDPLVELKNLKQTGDVTTYQDRFELLLNKVELTESQAVSMFIGGLKGEIGIPLRMFKPATMKDVTSLAKMQESSVAILRTRPNYSPYSGSRFQPNNVTPRPQSQI